MVVLRDNDRGFIFCDASTVKYAEDVEGKDNEGVGHVRTIPLLHVLHETLPSPEEDTIRNFFFALVTVGKCACFGNSPALHNQD